jgi:hypothetical protein
MNRLEHDLDALLAEYRNSVDVPEAGVNFMPKLWDRIEARRSFAFQWKRATQIFVGAAAAICLLFTGLTIAPRTTSSQHATYADVLAEAHPTENLVAQGIIHLDTVEGSK